MTSSPSLNQYMFTSELCRLTFLDVASSRLSFAISVQEREVFSNVYYPDSSNRVIIYGLDKLLESLSDDPMIDVTFEVNGQSYPIKVFYCSSQISEPAQTFLFRFFLTPVMSERNTAMGRHELLTAFCPEMEEVTAQCVYLLDNGSIESRTCSITKAIGRVIIDASPDKMASGEGRLIGYTVTCGERAASYRVLEYAPEADPAFFFRNSFRSWETIYLSGKKEVTTAYTRSQALIGGRLRNYDIEAVRSFKAMTGPLRSGTELAALDLAAAKDILILNPDGTVGEEVTITDCDTKYTNEDKEIPDFTFTYRIADRHTVRVSATPRPPQVFDGTFDDTYE